MSKMRKSNTVINYKSNSGPLAPTKSSDNRATSWKERISSDPCRRSFNDDPLSLFALKWFDALAQAVVIEARLPLGGVRQFGRRRLNGVVRYYAKAQHQ